MRAHTLYEALRYGHGVERTFLCPVHGDTTPSASVNVLKRKWFCYTCHASGGLDGEHATIEPDYEELRRWADEKLEENHVYPESWLNQFDAGDVHPYWEQRVGVEAARAHRLGYDAEADSATYPLRSTGGEVLGVVRRPLSDDWVGPKYVYPKGADISRLLYRNALVGRGGVLALVEGAVDAIALANVGVPAVAVYGSRFTPAQAALVERECPERVLTAFDHDDAGWEAHKQVRRLLRGHVVERLRWPLSWGKDVDELGPARLKKVVSDVVSDDMLCVESASCGSSSRSPSRTSSRSTSRRGSLVIVPRLA